MQNILQRLEAFSISLVTYKTREKFPREIHTYGLCGFIWQSLKLSLVSGL